MKLMRFVLVLLVGSVVATAIAGSAASVGLQTAKLSAASVPVPPCDTALTASWATAFDTGMQAYKVTTVTVGSIDGTACAGATLQVTLTSTSGTVLSTEKVAPMAAGETAKTFDVSSETIPANDMGAVHAVLVGPWS